MKKVNCVWCGKAMNPWGGSQLYCSEQCSGAMQRHRLKRLIKTCVQCGGEYKTRNSEQRFCTRDCHKKSLRITKGTVAQCVICGKDFDKKSKTQQCCGKECATVKRANTQRVYPDRKKRNNELEMIHARTDPAFALKRRVRVLMYYSLRGNKGGQKWQDLVGYSVDDLRRHIEKQFTDGMSWDQFLAGNIHIDHKTPVIVHNITSPDDIDFKKCWALKNLQPLWQHDNLSKHDRLDKPFQPSLALAVNASVGSIANAL